MVQVQISEDFLQIEYLHPWVDMIQLQFFEKCIAEDRLDLTWWRR